MAICSKKISNTVCSNLVSKPNSNHRTRCYGKHREKLEVHRVRNCYCTWNSLIDAVSIDGNCKRLDDTHNNATNSSPCSNLLLTAIFLCYTFQRRENNQCKLHNNLC